MKELKDYVRVYDDILTKDECDSIVERFEKEAQLEDVSSSIYKFSQLNVNKMPGWEDVAQMYSNLAFSGSMQYFNDVEVPIVPKLEGFEEIRIKRYRPGEDERFDLHVDVADYKSSRRFLVMFCYLSDCEGGETSFPTLDINVQPKAGRVLMFPPLWMFPHAAKPPVGSNKYIMGTYLHYV